ncbi:MAG: LuxR C-terminal-related transcriptional regulator, partial [Sporichthyaceae bacterium]
EPPDCAVLDGSVDRRRTTEGSASDWPLVGRSVEAARVAAALSGSGSAGGVVLVGGPGAGKTALARCCVGRAAGAGRPTLWLTGTAGTADIPLGALAGVLPELDPAASPEQLLHQASRAVRARANGRALVLAVDDGQWLDELSAALVARLVDDGHAVLVATVRAGTPVPEPLVNLWKNGRVQRLELEPLRREDVDEVLTAALGGPVEIATSGEFLRVSDGNPLFVRELFLAAHREGLLRRRGGSWSLDGPLPTSNRLAEVIETRLAGLEPPAREALELLAVGGALRLAHLERLVSLDVLEDLETAELLTIRQEAVGELVDLGHPLFGEVLRQEMPSLRARRLRGVLADALESAGDCDDVDLERVVRWRLAGGTTPAAASLLRVARRALARFDVDLARRTAADAHAAAPSAESALLLGRAQSLSGRHAEAEEVFAVGAALEAGETDAIELAMARADNLFHWLDRPEDGRAELAELAAGSALGAVRVSTRLANYDLYDGRPVDALRFLGAPVAHADARVTIDAGCTGAVAAMSCGHFALGLAHLAVVDAAVENLGGNVYSTSVAGIDLASRYAARMGIDLHRGRYADVVEFGLRAHQVAFEDASPTARGWVAHLLGAAHLAQGRVAEAIRWFREAVAASTTMSTESLHRIVLTGLAAAHAWAGDVDAAEKALAGVDDLPGRPLPLFESHVRRACAWVLAGRGRSAEAAEELIAAASGVVRDGQSLVFEAALLHDAVRVHPAAAARVADRLGEIALVVEGPLTAARALLARGLADGDAAAVETAAREFDALGATLFAVEAAHAAVGLASASGSSRRATSLRRYAADLAARCGGAATPGMPREQVETDGLLTEREAEIARLAAGGLASKAIAAQLFLSPRTVDNCLGRVFAKLGVTSRAELADALA